MRGVPRQGLCSSCREGPSGSGEGHFRTVPWYSTRRRGMRPAGGCSAGQRHTLAIGLGRHAVFLVCAREDSGAVKVPERALHTRLCRGREDARSQCAYHGDEKHEVPSATQRERGLCREEGGGGQGVPRINDVHLARTKRLQLLTRGRHSRHNLFEYSRIFIFCTSMKQKFDSMNSCRIPAMACLSESPLSRGETGSKQKREMESCSHGTFPFLSIRLFTPRLVQQANLPALFLFCHFFSTRPTRLIDFRAWDSRLVLTATKIVR